MATTGASARRKGHAFERRIANDFKDLGWPHAKRHLEVQKEEAELGIDIENVEPFLVQCKAHKKYSSITAINQVKLQEGGIPLLITKGDNLEPMVVLSWCHFRRFITNLNLNYIEH